MIIMNWECPRCDRTFPETTWTIGGALVQPSVWQRIAARHRGQRAHPFYRMWHRCPNGHQYAKGAPYAGFTSGPTQARLPDGSPVTFITMLGLRRPA